MLYTYCVVKVNKYKREQKMLIPKAINNVVAIIIGIDVSGSIAELDLQIEYDSTELTAEVLYEIKHNTPNSVAIDKHFNGLYFQTDLDIRWMCIAEAIVNAAIDNIRQTDQQTKKPRWPLIYKPNLGNVCIWDALSFSPILLKERVL